MKVRIDFDLGSTAHRQPLQLVAKPQNDGTFRYDLVKHAGNQRDDTVTLFDLSDESLEAITKAHAMMKDKFRA
jgi:hypothetical protein